MTGIILFFIIAVFFSMLGLGGGSAYVPLFSFLGYPLKSFAIPSGIFLVFLTALSSSITYVKHKMVDFFMAFSLLSGSLLAVLLGQIFFFQKVSARALWILLIIALMILGLRMLLLPEDRLQIRTKNKKMKLLAGFIMGVFSGFLSVTVGIGGGSLMVPFLLSMAFPIKRAIGTSSFVILFTSFTGFTTHFFSTFDRGRFSELLLFAAVVFTGGIVGSHLTALKISAKTARYLMGFLLIGIGVYLISKHF